MAAIVSAIAMVCIAQTPAAAAPSNVQMPFPCGETWYASTYSGHSPSAYSVDWNLVGNDEGRSVRAGVTGTATVKPFDPNGYGNWIEINAGGGWTFRYAHLSTITVTNGAQVSSQTEIGKVGSTGNSTGSHLHYEQRFNSIVQPATFNGQAITYQYSLPGTPYISQCPSPPPGDTDADGIADSQDGCPAVWGPSTNRGCPFDDHTLAGDFTNDGKTDVLAFYNHGNDNLGVWLFPGNGNGVGIQQLLWQTGNGQWDWNASQFMAGDFNNDGRSDALALYDYGNHNLGAWLFPGTGNGISGAQLQWKTGNGQWNSAAAVYITGNFNGDNRLDVLALYDYGSDNLGVWLFPGGGTSINREQHQWNTGNGQWNAKRTKVIGGDFNTDGRTDLLAFYDYGNDNLGAWLFPGGGTSITSQQLQWQTGNGMWNQNASRFIVGQYNTGNAPDILAFYNYGNDNLGVWLFPGNGTAINREQHLWKTGNGQWNWNCM